MSDSASTDVIAELERALREPGSAPLPRAILDLRPPGDARREVEWALNRMLHHLTVRKRFGSTAEFNFKDIDALYRASLDAGCPGCVTEALNYLRLYKGLAKRMSRLDLNGDSWFGGRVPEAAMAELAEEAEGVDRAEPGLVSTGLILGKLHALRDRATARRTFARAVNGTGGEMGPLKLDRGARTYFDSATLERDRGTIAERRESLPLRHEDEPLCGKRARSLIVLSCEREYLKLHLPYWLSLADYLKPLGFAFHVLFVERPGEATPILDDARALARALARLRGNDPVASDGNFSLSAVAIPRWCSDIPAFAACARLLYAQEIAERSGKPIVAVDIDMRIVVDPRPWFEALPTDRIVMYPGRMNLTIDPWRKFRAGIYALPGDDSCAVLSHRLADYLLRGLGEPDPWYVDQNALGYLYERVTDEGGAAGSLASLDDIRATFPFGGFELDYLLRSWSRDAAPTTLQDSR